MRSMQGYSRRVLAETGGEIGQSPALVERPLMLLALIWVAL